MNYKLVDEITGKGYERTKDAEYEHWYKDGKRHRLDGPAFIYYNNGNVTKEQWFNDNKLHRLDGPAYIHYDENGNVIKERWYKEGYRHRLDGPAIIYYNNGNVTKERWFKKGVRLYKKNFTSLDMINQFKAYSFFTPIELIRMRNEL